MNYLGIDFGTKNLGLAFARSDDFFSSPIGTLKNDNNLFKNLEKILIEKEISIIILGSPQFFKSHNNHILINKIINFKKKLIEKFNLEVFLEDESLTSNLILLNQGKNKNSVNKDIGAAILILDSYLTKK